MDFNIFDSNGERIECDIIGMFVHNDKNYIIYTNENDDVKEKEIYASLYKVEDNNMILLPIIEETDWDLIDRYLEGI